jgi:hypothetical protein
MLTLQTGIYKPSTSKFFANRYVSPPAFFRLFPFGLTAKSAMIWLTQARGGWKGIQQ